MNWAEGCSDVGDLSRAFPAARIGGAKPSLQAFNVRKRLGPAPFAGREDALSEVGRATRSSPDPLARHFKGAARSS